MDLSADQARYLGSVLRMNADDPVSVFNGRDGEWVCVIDQVKKERGRLAVRERTRAQGDEQGPWLAFTALKKSPMDFIAEKATELGVERLLPVLTEHTAVARVNTDRLTANAREAAEQCGRLTVPVVDAPRTLTALLDGWPAERPLLVMDETGEGMAITDVVGDTPRVGVLTGPEGGFSSDELDALRKLPFVTRVGLGPRILRAETAALAALTCVQAWAGDWHDTPPVRTSR